MGVFLYTWQLLPTLQIETSHVLLSKIYKYYRKISIWIVPSIFFGLYFSFSLLVVNKDQLESEGKEEQALNLSLVISRLFKAQGYLTTATNAISSVILIMTIRHANKVTKKQNQLNLDIDN